MNNYVVATVKEWNIEQYNQNVNKYPGNWYLISEKNDLKLEWLREISPRYIFFPHWSWVVPNEILNEFECVCFHMADVPYGRGGSPLQNLIVRGHKETKLTSLKMVEQLDAGPVYMKKDMGLEGAARDIYKKCSELTFGMIADIVKNEPDPVEQHGTIVEFRRRTPAESEIPTKGSLQHIYDLIRMLDADTYPKAFLNYGGFRVEFEKASLSTSNAVKASVMITKCEGANE